MNLKILLKGKGFRILTLFAFDVKRSKFDDKRSKFKNIRKK